MITQPSHRKSSRESYRTFAYKEQCNRELYSKINKAFNKLAFESLLSGDVLRLPKQIGDYQLVKYKPKKKNIDFFYTKKFNKTIKYDNQHTDGYVVMLKWYKKNATFRFKSFWKFKLVRSNIRLNDVSITKFINQNGVKNFVEL